MTMEVLELNAKQTLKNFEWIRGFLKQRSFHWRTTIESGELDHLMREAITSPHTIVCIATDSGPAGPAAMFLATVQPTFVRKVLCVDELVVAHAHQDSGLEKKLLLPHMKQLAINKKCTSVEITSSDPAVQRLFREAGFVVKPSITYQLVL